MIIGCVFVGGLLGWFDTDCEFDVEWVFVVGIRCCLRLCLLIAYCVVLTDRGGLLFDCIYVCFFVDLFTLYVMLWWVYFGLLWVFVLDCACEFGLFTC